MPTALPGLPVSLLPWLTPTRLLPLAPFSLPLLAFLKTGLQEDPGEAGGRLRMLRLAWAWSCSLSGQEHRLSFSAGLPTPSPHVSPTPRCGHTPSAIRAVRGLESHCERKAVHSPGGTRLSKKKCTVNLFKTTATNTHKREIKWNFKAGLARI